MIYVSFGIAIKVLSLVLSLLIDIRELLCYYYPISSHPFRPCSYPPYQVKKDSNMDSKTVPLFSGYLLMKHENPSLYWATRTQTEMAQACQFHGKAFYDLYEEHQS